MKIDAHAHLGLDVVFDEEQTEQELIECYDKYNIDAAIVQPLICRPYMSETRAIHDRIAKLCKDKPGRFFGMISMNPHFFPEDYEAEAVRCVKELGFVGIKITPIAQAVHPSSKDAFNVYEVARKLNVPVMIHTGAGTPFADPISAWKAAESFPDVKFILAHAGVNIVMQQATLMALKFENVYLEPSWVPVQTLASMYKTVGVKKIMFSSDMAVNVPMELTKYKEAIPNEEDREQAMSKTAIEVFNLKI